MIFLVAGGNIKGTLEEGIFKEYQKRIRWPLKIIELKDASKMEQVLANASYWIALDEGGQNLTSKDFSGLVSKSIEIHQHIGFLIGIDTGIPKAIKDKCQYKLALGAMTWPHLLARVLLIEQIYRAQQIMDNHPYHK